jgi:hypothetical protein
MGPGKKVRHLVWYALDPVLLLPLVLVITLVLLLLLVILWVLSLVVDVVLGTARRVGRDGGTGGTITFLFNTEDDEVDIADEEVADE